MNCPYHVLRVIVLIGLASFCLAFNVVAQDKQSVPLTPEMIHRIHISDDTGIIKDKFIAGDNMTQFLVSIQDAHCHYEAQMNISKIVKLLVSEFGFTLVNVEGTAGLIDTKPFASFGDRKIRLEFADSFMQQGKITGPEYLSITTDLDFTLFGIEDETLYARNYTAFMKTLTYREKVENFTSRLNRALERIRHHVYDEDLKSLDQIIEKYDSGINDYLEYTKNLYLLAKSHDIDLSGFENFLPQIEIQDLEKKIDRKMLEDQRTLLVEELLKAYEDQPEMVRDIHGQAQKFTRREIDQEAYFSNMIDLAKAKSISLEPYVQVKVYAEYVQVYNKLDKQKLADETIRVQHHIREKLYKNETQRTLGKLIYRLDILERIFKFEVTNGEYRQFKQNKEDFNLKDAYEFIKREGPAHKVFIIFDLDENLITDNIRHVVDFYEVALERDAALLNNSLNQMKLIGADRSIVVTGGFHSEGITRQLRDMNVSYLLIAPVVKNITTNTPYIDVMKAQENSVPGYSPEAA